MRSASECVGRRRHCRCDRWTHSDAECTCPAVGPTQFTPSHQTRRDGPVSVVFGVWRAGMNWQLLLTCSDFKFSVGDSLELSGITFTPPKRTRHRQDSFVVSGVAVCIGFQRMTSNLSWLCRSVDAMTRPCCKQNRNSTNDVSFHAEAPVCWNSLKANSHHHTVNGNCSIHTGTPDTTRTRLFCRVWCGRVN